MNPRSADEPPIDFSGEMRVLLELFLETRRADLVRLDAALASLDFPAIRAIGHAFRGSSASFGFPEAGRIGVALEEAAGRADRAAVEDLVPRLRASIPDAGSEPPGPP